MTVLTLLIAGCSKPEEVISRRVLQANQNLEAGRPAKAIESLEEVNRKYPDQPSVLEALGFAYARSGQHGAAATCFVRAADIDSRSVSLRQIAAEAFQQDGAADRAAEQYRLYLGEFPTDYQTWLKLGEVEERRNNLIRANEAYMEYYRLKEPKSSDAAFRLGRVFRRLNNAPQAKAWFEATIKHGESHIDEALLGLLELEAGARDYAAAERTVSQLDSIFPGVLDASPLASVRTDIAAWKETQKAVETARAEQEKAAKELQEARRQREAELAAMATPTTAPTSAEPPVTPPPDAEAPPPAAPPPEAVTNAESPVLPPSAETASPSVDPPPAPPPPPDLAAALAFKEAGHLDQAIDQLWNALSRDDRLDLWMELAACYRLQRRFADAEACLLEATRHAQESVYVAISYLELIHESQPADEYLARIETTRRKFPADPTLAWMLARGIAEAKGDTVRAVSAYEDFLLLAPTDDPRRAEAIAFLARARGR